MSLIEHVWDALDLRIRRHVAVPANIQQLHTAVAEDLTSFPLAVVNNLISIAVSFRFDLEADASCGA